MMVNRYTGTGDHTHRRHTHEGSRWLVSPPPYANFPLMLLTLAVSQREGSLSEDVAPQNIRQSATMRALFEVLPYTRRARDRCQRARRQRRVPRAALVKGTHKGCDEALCAREAERRVVLRRDSVGGRPLEELIAQAAKERLEDESGSDGRRSRRDGHGVGAVRGVRTCAHPLLARSRSGS